MDELTGKEIETLSKNSVDIMDLAGELSWHLSPTKREDNDWLGRDEPDFQRRGIGQNILRRMPEIPDEIRGFLCEAGLSEGERMRRAYSILDAVDNLVGTIAHPMRPALEQSRVHVRIKAVDKEF